MADVVVSDRAAEWLQDAEADVRDRITKKLYEIEDFPGHYLKRLRDSPYYRLRVGDYRVIIDWDQSASELFVREIGHRRNVYD